MSLREIGFWRAAMDSVYHCCGDCCTGGGCQSFHLDHSDSARLIQSTFFVLGIAAVIQCLKGHRLPINESPAGLWWGVYTIYAGLTGTVFATYGDTLRGLQGALLVSAVCFFLLSVFKVIDRLAKLFTPVVTGVYLLLLVMQLSQPIIKGILGIGYRQDGVDGLVFGLALVVIAAAFIMTNSNIMFFKQYSILLALFGGWVLFAAAGAAKPIEMPDRLFQLPSLFPFGTPLFNSGLIITSIFITILLIVNMLASMKIVDIAVKKFSKQPDEKHHERHAGFAASFSHLLSGLTGAIAPVPISGAAGFIETTKMPSKKPFMLGSILVIVISVIPFFMNAFASLPSPVGFAVNFVVFSAMGGLAFAEFDSYEKESKRVRSIIGISLLTGVGIMFVPELR